MTVCSYVLSMQWKNQWEKSTFSIHWFHCPSVLQATHLVTFFFFNIWEPSCSIPSTLGILLDHQGPGFLPQGSWYCCPGQVIMCSQAAGALLRSRCSQGTNDSNCFWLLLSSLHHSFLPTGCACLHRKAGGHPGCCTSLPLLSAGVSWHNLAVPSFVWQLSCIQFSKALLFFFSFLRSRSIISAFLSFCLL